MRQALEKFRKQVDIVAKAPMISKAFAANAALKAADALLEELLERIERQDARLDALMRVVHDMQPFPRPDFETWLTQVIIDNA